MEDPLLKFIGFRIYTLRMSKGKSARELSLLLGQNPNYVNNIENEINFPSIQVLNSICEYFGISLKDFFDEENKEPKLAKETWNEFAKLDKKTLESFIQLAKKINGSE